MSSGSESNEIVAVPEPFRSALRSGATQAICDAAADTAAALYGRALARASLGRGTDARADLEAATSELGAPCRLELALLDLQLERAAKPALAAATEIAELAPTGGPLQAHALFVVGQAEAQLRHSARATEALLRAAAIYRELGEPLRRARVNDALGRVEAARGRLDHALHFYALSLVDKALEGDRAGMAITLGNLGRLHLRAARYADAQDCFERDLVLARELGDLRGVARMHNDCGRALHGLGRYPEAEAELRRAIDVAREHGVPLWEFYPRKDLARLWIEQGGARLADARSELDAARRVLPAGAAPYLRHLLAHAEGEFAWASGDEDALALLEGAVAGFVELDMPDDEIAARLSLARALSDRGLKASAEGCLAAGLRRARSDGYARYLPALNEAMTRLALVEGAVEEAPRASFGAGAVPENAYQMFERLGGGAFGEVYRAYDPVRARIVALKHMTLASLYDPRRRKRLLDSMRVEIEAASRVRHPGVVRVYAIGAEADGDVYIVQELIEGVPLRDVMPADTSADVTQVLTSLALIADALASLHEAGVVHRDLKPENVLLRAADGTPVLLDFGIAHVLDPRADLAAGPVAGTLPYMAPEQLAGRKLDGRADLYALGVIAYEWLAGTRPLRIRGDDYRERVRDLATRRPPKLREFRPQVPREVEALVHGLLEKKPRRRPESAAAFAAAVRRIVGTA